MKIKGPIYITYSRYPFREENLIEINLSLSFLTLLLSYLLNYIALNYALNYFNPYLAQIISGGLYTVSSFLIMKFFVFSNIERFKALSLITSSILGFIYYNQIRVDITPT